jgi:hypothetical protein
MSNEKTVAPGITIREIDPRNPRDIFRPSPSKVYKKGGRWILELEIGDGSTLPLTVEAKRMKRAFENSGVDDPNFFLVRYQLERVVGVGWQKRLFVFDNQDITPLMRELYDLLDPDNLDQGEDHPIDREAVREIGVKLNEVGGFELMQTACMWTKLMVGGKVEAGQIECFWNGVGQWMW